MFKFVLRKVKENFNEDQLRQVLKSKGFNGRNLLHTAVTTCSDINFHKFLWKISFNSCRSDGEFLEILKEVDSENDNIFLLTIFFFFF